MTYFTADIIKVQQNSKVGSVVVFSKVLDDKVYEEYASKLLPRAVGYSGGVLKYFFRGNIEITLPDSGVYAQTGNPDDGFTEVKLNARNITPNDEEMKDGTIELVVKYKIAQENPFQSKEVATSADFSYIVVPEANGVRSIPRVPEDQPKPQELVFDLSSTPIPLYAMDVYLQVVYHGKLGSEDEAVAVGFNDISEPTPIDLFNNMDRDCLFNDWYIADSQEAIDKVDRNKNGIVDPDECDVFSHELVDIYIRFSSEGDPKLVSSTDNNLHIPALTPGSYSKTAFILTDYQFAISDIVTKLVHEDPKDPGVWKYQTPKIIQGPAIKSQTDLRAGTPEECIAGGLQPPCTISGRVYPEFTYFRGLQLWGPIVYENEYYPSDSVCPYESIP